ncbi:MAG: MFS transporter [Nitrospinota bacterium]|nr:MAG: MFS transporter [Nitrospinota bacterium]
MQGGVRTRRHHGWYVVGSAFLLLFFTGASRFAFGVVFKPMLADFGWTRGTLSLAFTLNMTLMSLTQPWAGRLFDRHGPRKILGVFTTITAIGLLLTGWIAAPWHLFLTYGLLTGIGFGGVSTSVVSALLSRWFPYRTGLTVGIAMGGLALGQLLLVPLINHLVLHMGWQYAYVLLGSSVALLCLPLIAWIITLPQEEGRSQKAGLSELFPVRSLRGAMRTRNFWWIAITYVICGFQDFLVMTHLVPLATDLGLDPVRAGHYLGWMGGISFPGVLLFGLLSDYLGRTGPLALTFFLRFFGFLLVLFSPGAHTLLLFTLIFGLTFFASGPIAPALLHTLYGPRHLGEITGVIMLLHSLAGGLGSYAGGLSFDQMGSYRGALILALILAGIAIFSSLVIQEHSSSREAQ